MSLSVCLFLCVSVFSRERHNVQMLRASLSEMSVPGDVTLLYYLTSKNTKSMFLSPADENEVLSVVHSCKSKTSIDNDGHNMKFVKKYNTLYC